MTIYTDTSNIELIDERHCYHPIPRLYSWIAKDDLGETLYVGCCSCGNIVAQKDLTVRANKRRDNEHKH